MRADLERITSALSPLFVVDPPDASIAGEEISFSLPMPLPAVVREAMYP